MRNQAELEKKISEEAELLALKEIDVILNIRDNKDDDTISQSFRECTDINRRIMTLRWVLGEVSEL